MIGKKGFFLVFALLSISIFAQSDTLFNQMKNAYQSNNYRRAIELSDMVLAQNLNEKVMMKVNEIRAVCFYSIGQKDSSKISFIAILRIDDSYLPNQLFISPKIVLFFNSIKLDYEKIISDKKIKTFQTKVDSSKIKENRDRILMTIAYSILLPGIGQLRTEQNTKGVYITGASVALLGASIYFILKTNRLEIKYQNESDKILIQEKYDSYNGSYQIRNVLLISYGLVWIFSQLDLLVFNQEKLFGNNLSFSTLLTNTHRTSQLSFTIQYLFWLCKAAHSVYILHNQNIIRSTISLKT